MPEPTPLLTIAIPTYNRAACLQEFLSVLLPQWAGNDDVDILVSDNASTDATAEVLQAAAATHPRLRVYTQPENIGSDRNFVFCFREARGRYFWLCGDDDILRPGTLASLLPHLRASDFDLVHVTSEAFTRDWRSEYSGDRYHRGAEVIRSARSMALILNVMVTFISGIIINRERLGQIDAEPPEVLIGTNLVQLSWTLPLLSRHRQSLVLWQRWVSGRDMNSGGYSLAEVFGERFAALAHRLLPRDPRLARIFVNYTLRQWFPAMVLQLRQTGNGNYGLAEIDAILRLRFSRNPRFWISIWPVLRLPLPLARLWQAAFVRANHLANLLLMPRRNLRKALSRVRPARPSHHSW